MRRLHGLAVAPEEFIPFGGQGEARFLGGVAEKYGVAGYDAAAAKALFFDVCECRGGGAWEARPGGAGGRGGAGERRSARPWAAGEGRQPGGQPRAVRA
jgi:hypothetical protein